MEVAADIVNLMLAHRPDIAQRMSDAGASLAIIPKDGYITEIPELSHLQGRLDPNGNPYDSFRVRGAGGTPGQTTTVTSEENLLDLDEDRTRFWAEDIIVHEWAHAIENLGFDDATRAEWRDLFDRSREAGLWPGTFAMAVDEGREFFAEVSQSFFEVNNSLTLYSNRLTGEIPQELGNLSNLFRLTLHNNQLTGRIPRELGNLSNLTHAYFAGNRLTGCVPSGLQDVQHNDFAALGIPFCAAAPVGSPPASQQAPDLVVTLTISGGGLLYSGATATATARVFNEGDATASDYTLRFYRSQDRRFTNNNVMSSVRPEDLRSSTNSIRRLGFTVPADEGDYYFAACVDGVPGESDTTNNCSDWTSASILHPVTLPTSDCSTGHIRGVVPDSTEISGTVLARRSVSQANVIWRVIDALGNTNSSGIELLESWPETDRIMARGYTPGNQG